MRRLPFVLLLLLLPVPAQAHRHKWEAVAGLSIGSVTGGFSIAGRLWPSPFSTPVGGVPQSVFLFLEGADNLSRDSAHTLDDWMIGLRWRLRDGGKVEPFVHVMVGSHSPSRPDGVLAATTSSTAAGIGGGIDHTLGGPWLVRFQGDASGSWPSSGFDPHLRATVGLVVRWGGR